MIYASCTPMANPTLVYSAILLSTLFIVNIYAKDPPFITYDARSLIINGTRDLFFSGSIHYPRSTPEMWGDIIKKAKDGGINVIQTYIFWNYHEPVQGKWEMDGNRDFVKFLRMVGEQGLWATIRIGPFISAEWNFGGFPYWLKMVPGIVFRCLNEPFMFHMKKYSETVINLCKEAKLFADQGGPIILAQVENEYDSVLGSYAKHGLRGPEYVQWAAEMAISLYDGVPWVMCKAQNSPPQVISACNGRECGDSFSGPGPNKPIIWTENWTQRKREYGESPSRRIAEDIAFHVSRFFSRKGTLTNYYMYHGGTNFGRSPASFIPSRYYDDAPLDEFALPKDPKYSHLRDLHRALRLCQRPLLEGTQLVQQISKDLEITTFETSDHNGCAAFLSNNDTNAQTIKFRGASYFLPSKSVSILPDCKTVVFNSQTVVSQHNSRNLIPSKKAKIKKWEMFREKIPEENEMPIKHKVPLELFQLLQDTTDYAWYRSRFHLKDSDLPTRSDIRATVWVDNMGHALIVYVNGEYLGFQHGNDTHKRHVYENPVNLHTGRNEIAILAMSVGLPNAGALMETRFGGPKSVVLRGLTSGILDITPNKWSHQVGLSGENLQLFTEEGSKKVEWLPFNATPQHLTWYKGYFDAPEGDDPLALPMMTMSKGMVWINGRSIGRYWSSFLSPEGLPAQEEYHVPRSFLKPTDNLIVILEEVGGNPEKIEVLKVNRDTICSVITKYHPPHVQSFELKKGQLLRSKVDAVKGAKLVCPDKKVVEKVEFASFGNAEGDCGKFKMGSCDTGKAQEVAEKECLGKNECTVAYDNKTLMDGDKDPCPDIPKTLTIQVKCGHPGLDAAEA